MAGTETMVKTGILYGVGVGPGDPELMTVKAWRLISMAPVIAYLAANGKDSTARDIALPFIPDDAEHLVIDMPMRTEREPGERAYDFGAAAIAVRASLIETSWSNSGCSHLSQMYPSENGNNRLIRSELK